MFRGKTFQLTLPGKSYHKFIEGLKSPVTKAAYSYALQKYMNHLNISNPDDLLIHFENPKIIQNQIIEYLIQLKNPPSSLRYATRSQYLAAIMTFYELNDVPLSKKKIYRYLGEEERPIDNRGYTKEEISKMLDVCDERSRAIILLLTSTGIRIRAIIDLKIEDFVFVPEYKMYQLRVYSDSNQWYLTFTTPEAAKARNDFAKDQIVIDGKNVENVEQYRVTTDFYNMTFPKDNMFSVPAGTFRSLLDGTWMMLKPLPVGDHKVEVHIVQIIPGRESDNLFLNLIYNLHVTDPSIVK